MNPLFLLPILLQVAALIHFVKYRSGTWIWLWIIIFLGPIGAIVYLIVEVLPELGATQASSGWLAKRKRLRYLEAVVQENPSIGNYEELADLYREQNDFARARECYNLAINSRTDFPDPFYGRALCALACGDLAAAVSRPGESGFVRPQICLPARARPAGAVLRGVGPRG